MYQNNLVKIIYGLRRSGKSVILSQIIDEIKNNGVDDEHIIYINFESLDFGEIKDIHSLNNFIKGKIKDNPYKFNEDDIYYINQFKTGLEDNNYIFIGTNSEYAKFLSKDGTKIYMVKGLNSNLDEVLDTSKVPYTINTYLLIFENYIIYTGMISN